MKENSLRPNLLDNVDYFRDFVKSNPPDVVESEVIRLQSEKIKERAPGKYGIILFTVNNFPQVRPHYHFGRGLDDIADGDAKLPNGFDNFSDLIGYLKRKVETDDHSVDKGGYVEFLLYRSIQKLSGSAKSEEIKGGVNNFLDSMHTEYERREKGLVLSREELDDLYSRSFGSSYDMAFIATGSKNRAMEIVPLLTAQGRTFALSDLQKDLEMGICNIPLEVINDAGVDLKQLRNNSKLVNENLSLQDWIEDEFVECRKLLGNILYSKLDLKAKVIVFYFKTGVEWAIKKAEGRQK